MEEIFDSLQYPEITLETEDIKMNLEIKKDYSKYSNIHERKNAFFKDLALFLLEFNDAPESLDLLKYYD